MKKSIKIYPSNPSDGLLKLEELIENLPISYYIESIEIKVGGWKRYTVETIEEAMDVLNEILYEMEGAAKRPTIKVVVYIVP
jgi:hypothetical protein